MVMIHVSVIAPLPLPFHRAVPSRRRETSASCGVSECNLRTLKWHLQDAHLLRWQQRGENGATTGSSGPLLSPSAQIFHEHLVLPTTRLHLPSFPLPWHSRCPWRTFTTPQLETEKKENKALDEEKMRDLIVVHSSITLVCHVTCFDRQIWIMFWADRNLIVVVVAVRYLCLWLENQQRVSVFPTKCDHRLRIL